MAVLFPKAGPRVPPRRGHQSRQTASSCWPGFHVGASLGEGPPRGWAARVTGPHSGPHLGRPKSSHSQGKQLWAELRRRGGGGGTFWGGHIVG